MAQNPALSLSITKWMGWRLKRIESRFENLIFRDVRTGLMTTLNDLAEKYAEGSERGRRIAIKLSHQELANLVGATRETVTLELNNLKRSGEIIAEDRTFILPEKDLHHGCGAPGRPCPASTGGQKNQPLTMAAR